MEKDIELKNELQRTYWDYMKSRWQECIDKKLKVRLAIDFANGYVVSIQNQEILAGTTLMNYAMNGT